MQTETSLKKASALATKLGSIKQYKNMCWKVSNSIFNNKNIAKKALNLTQLSHTTSKQNEYAHIYTHYIYTLDTVDPWQRRVCRSVTCL